MKAFLLKLTSRKFLLAVAAVATLLANHQYPAAAAAAVAYIAAETHLDKNSIIAEASKEIHTMYPDVPELEPAIGFAGPEALDEEEPVVVPPSHGQVTMGFTGKVRS